MSDVLSDSAVIDEVAKELYARRVFNIKDMKDYELEESARDCFRKARIFAKVRRDSHSPL